TNGLAVVENSGSVVGELPVPGASYGCQVLRWWQPGQPLALCSGSKGQTFWDVPLTGGAPTAVVSGGQGGSAFDIWQINGSFYAQEGVCGTLLLDKLSPTGVGSPVTVPGTLASDSLQVIGVYGNNI